ncbi:hypothetical protein GBAR_LOCUS10624, partial [Geodia barretti]
MPSFLTKISARPAVLRGTLTTRQWSQRKQSVYHTDISCPVSAHNEWDPLEVCTL